MPLLGLCLYLYQAQAVDIDPFSKSVTVRPSLSPVRGEIVQAASENDDKGQASSDPSFHSDLSLEYDTLVYACGVTAARSKVPGVSEYCYFLKEVDDARSLRRACGDALERALGPNVGDDADAQRAALTFVVVGGGPTGVEFAGELTDFLRDTVKRFFHASKGKLGSFLCMVGPRYYHNSTRHFDRVLLTLSAPVV